MTASPRQTTYFKNLARAAAQAADDKKGEGIRLLHVRRVTALCDYLLLVSVTSPNHLAAVEEHIRGTLKSAGSHVQHRDGRASDVWRVLDYGGLLIHLMHPKAREFYALDKLYYGAREVDFNDSPTESAAAPALKTIPKIRAARPAASARPKARKSDG